MFAKELEDYFLISCMNLDDNMYSFHTGRGNYAGICELKRHHSNVEFMFCGSNKKV